MDELMGMAARDGSVELQIWVAERLIEQGDIESLARLTGGHRQHGSKDVLAITRILGMLPPGADSAPVRKNLITERLLADELPEDEELAAISEFRDDPQFLYGLTKKMSEYRPGPAHIAEIVKHLGDGGQHKMIGEISRQYPDAVIDYYLKAAKEDVSVLGKIDMESLFTICITNRRDAKELRLLAMGQIDGYEERKKGECFPMFCYRLAYTMSLIEDIEIASAALRILERHGSRNEDLRSRVASELSDFFKNYRIRCWEIRESVAAAIERLQYDGEMIEPKMKAPVKPGPENSLPRQPLRQKA